MELKSKLRTLEVLAFGVLVGASFLATVGCIPFLIYLGSYCNKLNKEAERVRIEAFQIADTDSSGVLELDEMKELGLELGILGKGEVMAPRQLEKELYYSIPYSSYKNYVEKYRR